MNADTVVSKVKKLMALAGNNPSQEEAESAMMRAQQLLAEHGLSMAHVEAASEEQQEATVHKADRTTKVATWWHKDIAQIVAYNFRCKTYINLEGRNGSGMMFVGIPEDVIVASDVFTMAVKTCSKEAAKYIKMRKRRAEMGGTWNRSKSNAIRNDYIRGWTRGLGEAFRRNVETFALVVVRPRTVDEKYETLGLRTTRPSLRASACSERAMEEGKKDGRRFNRRERLR